jgi:predicted metalloprotease with PDZ domain
MNKYALAAWLSFFALAACATSKSKEEVQKVSAPNVEYRIHFAPVSQMPEIQIDLMFMGSSSGQTKLILPLGLYDKKLFAGFTDLAIEGPGSIENISGSDTAKLIRHAPGATLRIRYSLHQMAASDEPAINSKYFYFSGALLAHPDTGDQTAHLKIDWEVPKDWSLANSFGANEFHQEVSGVFNNNPVDNLRYAAFVAGDFRIHKLMIHAHLVVFATRGKWFIPDNQIVDVVQKVVSGQREMWRDFEVPYYFVLLLPKDTPCCYRDGYGLTHSFVAILSNREYGLQRFTHLLAHEHFHYWNGEELSPQPGKNEFWFTEGFTDYYARILNLRSGLTTYPEFVDDFNSAIYRYYESPDRNANDERIEKDLIVLAYSKGNIYANEWNLAIKNKTNNQQSLDDFMRKLRKDSSQLSLPLSKELVRKTLAFFVGEASANSLMEKSLDGSLLLPSDSGLGPCAHLKIVNLPRLDYGYDHNNFKKITKLEHESAAAAAGLRDGQKILDRREEWWKPWKPVKVQVDDSNGVRWIKYLPQSKNSLKIPQYAVEEKVSEKCGDWFKN